MKNFVIDTSSLSESEILSDLNSFLNTRPTAARWEVYFQSQVGQTVVKYIQGMASFFAIKATLGRREAFPLYAQNRSSVIGGSQFQGYSAFRGRNATLTLTIIPNFTGTISEFDVVGGVGSAELVSLETKVVNEDVPVQLKVIAGNKLESTIKAQSDGASFFRFEGNDTVSSDLRILVQGTPAETSENLLDVQDNFFFVQANAVGAVDIFSLNNVSAPVRFDTNDDITIEYIELKEIVFDDTDLEFDFGNITNIRRDTIYQPPEDIDQVRFNAPLQNQVRDVIRAREDQPKQLQIVDSSIIDATGEDVSAAIMRLFYLRRDRILFNQSEIADLVQGWMRYRPFGIMPPEIAAPVRKPIILKVDATLEDVVGMPENDVQGLINQLEDDLDSKINLVDLEKSIENLNTIKIARPLFGSTDWASNGKLEIGQHINPTSSNGKIYQVLEILYFSGSSEPSWPTNANDLIIDGDVEFKAVPRDDVAAFVDWQADTPYRVGDRVRPTTANGFIYEVTQTFNKSGSSEPTWPTLNGNEPSDILGQFVNDGDIKWIARPLQGTVPDWQADTVYKKGDVVVATDTTASDTVGVMFQAFAYLGTLGSSEPSFPTVNDQTVDDNNLRLTTQSPDQIELESGTDGYFTIELEFNAS